MDVVRDTAETFRDLANAVGSASQGAQQISANVQQSVAIQQVVEAVSSINVDAR